MAQPDLSDSGEVCAISCPHCEQPVTTSGHRAQTQYIFGHKFDVIECPKMIGWYLLWAWRN